MALDTVDESKGTPPCNQVPALDRSSRSTNYDPRRHSVLHAPRHSSSRIRAPSHASALNHANRPLIKSYILGHYPMSMEDEENRSIRPFMRPNRLIGDFKPIFNWKEFEAHPDATRKTKQYYTDQQELIDRLVEIDDFLDAGKMHYHILKNYEETPSDKNTSKDTTVDEHQPLLPNLAGNYMSKSDSVNSRKSRRLDEVPGNVHNEGSQFLGLEQGESHYQVYLAIMVNFLVNFVLLVGKIAILILTNSMSMVASLVDSVLDFLSTFIIYIANRLTRQKNWRVSHLYPVGRSRLEPLGVLVFLVIIIISFFQVGQESLKRLLFSTPEQRVAARVGFDAIVIMILTILAKLGCWLWCMKSSSSSVQALAQDAMTDIVFNTVSLLMPTAGYMLNIWWLDPLGAMLLSVYIIVLWCATAYEHIDNLTGAAADPVDCKVILYLAFRFAESIKKITALKVYHVGDHLNVEIDVVFALKEFDLTFKDCHDIAESLQYLIETLPMVERAFVHIDYMTGNYKGHLT